KLGIIKVVDQLCQLLGINPGNRLQLLLKEWYDRGTGGRQQADSPECLDAVTTAQVIVEVGELLGIEIGRLLIDADHIPDQRGCVAAAGNQRFPVGSEGQSGDFALMPGELLAHFAGSRLPELNGPVVAIGGGCGQGPAIAGKDEAESHADVVI